MKLQELLYRCADEPTKYGRGVFFDDDTKEPICPIAVEVLHPAGVVYDDDRALCEAARLLGCSDDEVALFIQWWDNGFPYGSGTEYARASDLLRSVGYDVPELRERDDAS